MTTVNAPAWRAVFRKGLLPQFSLGALDAVRDALRDDDARLTQGSSTTPPPLACVQEWPCEGACLVGYAGWQGEGLDTVGDVEEFFVNACSEADRRIGEPSAVRHFLNWFDDTPRDVMRRELLAEIEQYIGENDMPYGWVGLDPPNAGMPTDAELAVEF